MWIKTRPGTIANLAHFMELTARSTSVTATGTGQQPLLLGEVPNDEKSAQNIERMLLVITNALESNKGYLDLQTSFQPEKPKTAGAEWEEHLQQDKKIYL